jgi:hypothetical protein
MLSILRHRTRGLVAIVLALGAACGVAQTAEPSGDPFEAAAAAARARAAELIERGGPFSVEDARGLLIVALIDVDRFSEDETFRARALERLSSVLPDDAPAALRERVLYELESGPGLPFEASEALEVAWGAAVRGTASREVPAPASGLVFPDEIDAPIEATFFSFPSRWFGGDVEPLARLLRAVRERAPEREIVVLADLPVREPLETAVPDLGIRWIESHGLPYSPWPRDPFSTARLPGGGLVLVNRPDLQGGREGDAWMARELIQNLPPELDERWGGPRGDQGGVRWAEAPFFFHNGHVVMAGGAAWTSLHGLERRVLEVLGLDRVPVESFATDGGVDRYAEAARKVMDEMSAFYGKSVRLVHPLPPRGMPIERRGAIMQAIGGGASIDLDSIVSFVPAPDSDESSEGLIALVGDLDAGRELVAALSNDDLRSLKETYDLSPPPRDLQGLLVGAQRAHRAASLDAFLELIAGHLAAEGVEVRRLPLLGVPTTLLSDRERYEHDHFLIGWHNVVLETRSGRVRAEGFASGVAAGDALARRIYQEAGVELTLLPPLVESVKSNGGYRCASNQVRSPRP